MPDSLWLHAADRLWNLTVKVWEFCTFTSNFETTRLYRSYSAIKGWHRGSNTTVASPNELTPTGRLRAAGTRSKNKMQNMVFNKATNNKGTCKCDKCLFTFKSEELKLCPARNLHFCFDCSYLLTCIEIKFHLKGKKTVNTFSF